jgi:hypothetical protein
MLVNTPVTRTNQFSHVLPAGFDDDAPWTRIEGRLAEPRGFAEQRSHHTVLMLLLKKEEKNKKKEEQYV